MDPQAAARCQPHRLMIAERHRRPRPEGRRLRHLHDGLEMAQRPDGVWLTVDQRSSSAASNSAGTSCERSGRHLAEIGHPLADLGERDAHQPAAALARAARQRHHRAERHQVAGAIVDRRHRIELRARRLARARSRPGGSVMPLTVCTTVSKPRRDAHGPLWPKARERDIDEARPQRRQLLGRQAAAAQRAGPVALREHIGLAHQPAQGLEHRSAGADRAGPRACRARCPIPGSRGWADARR